MFTYNEFCDKLFGLILSEVFFEVRYWTTKTLLYQCSTPTTLLILNSDTALSISFFVFTFLSVHLHHVWLWLRKANMSGKQCIQELSDQGIQCLHMHIYLGSAWQELISKKEDNVIERVLIQSFTKNELDHSWKCLQAGMREIIQDPVEWNSIDFNNRLAAN